MALTERPYLCKDAIALLNLLLISVKRFLLTGSFMVVFSACHDQHTHSSHAQLVRVTRKVAWIRCTNSFLQANRSYELHGSEGVTQGAVGVRSRSFGLGRGLPGAGWGVGSGGGGRAILRARWLLAMLASTMSGTLGSMAVARAESGSASPGTPTISTSASHSSTCRDLSTHAAYLSALQA